MMAQAPFRHDGTTARDNARHALGGHRHVCKPHARMDGEIINALLRLLNQRVTENFPGKVFRHTVHLLQRLIDRHRANRHRRIANYPFARIVNIAAGGKVHHIVSAPARGPHHLVHFFRHRRRDR